MKRFEQVNRGQLFCGDVFDFINELDDNSLDCIVSSPPYYRLRDYKESKQIGMEETIHLYVAKIAEVFGKIKDKLKPTGTCWLNIADSYSHSGGAGNNGTNHTAFGRVMEPGRAHKSHYEKGFPKKTLLLIPQRLLIALQDIGWIVRQVIIWKKPNPIPNPASDRFCQNFEYVYFLTKSEQYLFQTQYEPLSNPKAKSKNSSRKHTGYGNPTYSGFSYDAADYKNGRIMRAVWTVPPGRLAANHFASFPKNLVRIAINAGCPKGGVVCDPFMGSGTTAVVSEEQGLKWVGCDINREYIELTKSRVQTIQPAFL